MAEEVERYGHQMYRYELSLVCSAYDLMISHYIKEVGGYVRFVTLKTKERFSINDHPYNKLHIYIDESKRNPYGDNEDLFSFGGWCRDIVTVGSLRPGERNLSTYVRGEVDTFAKKGWIELEYPPALKK